MQMVPVNQREKSLHKIHKGHSTLERLAKSNIKKIVKVFSQIRSQAETTLPYFGTGCSLNDVIAFVHYVRQVY